VDADAVAELIAGSAVFSDLNLIQTRGLAAIASTNTLLRDETLFMEGDFGETLYVVAEGMVKLTVTSSEGREMLLAVLQPPDSFGELSLIDGGRRSATATAVSATTLVAMGRTELLRALHEEPALVDGMLRSIGSLARKVSDQAADLVFLDVQGRVAKLLLSLAARARESMGDPQTITMPLPQGEMAEMVGVSRQSYNQALRRLADRGWIALGDGEVTVLDASALERRSER
jgi:CRP/FNR family cyclic AMP-dependent transcriptional regulator